jgi:hypothetical protein
MKIATLFFLGNMIKPFKDNAKGYHKMRFNVAHRSPLSLILLPWGEGDSDWRFGSIINGTTTHCAL